MSGIGAEGGSNYRATRQAELAQKREENRALAERLHPLATTVNYELGRPVFNERYRRGGHGTTSTRNLVAELAVITIDPDDPHKRELPNPRVRLEVRSVPPEQIKIPQPGANIPDNRSWLRYKHDFDLKNPEDGALLESLLTKTQEHAISEDRISEGKRPPAEVLLLEILEQFDRSYSKPQGSELNPTIGSEMRFQEEMGGAVDKVLSAS